MVFVCLLYSSPSPPLSLRLSQYHILRPSLPCLSPSLSCTSASFFLQILPLIFISRSFSLSLFLARNISLNLPIVSLNICISPVLFTLFILVVWI